MKIVGVIPARYESSRFPGKPLADIFGKPMVWYVYSQAKQVTELDEVYVATDDERIEKVCVNLGIPVVMTDKNHKSGVDRLAEVALKINADHYILIQGDEPLIEPSTIKEMVKRVLQNKDSECVLTFKTPITNPVDAVNSTIIKIVTDLNDRILFASRSAIPYPKENVEFTFFKTVGVYCYPKSVLQRYPSLTRGIIERAEEHDIIRPLENGICVKAYEIETDTISVDTPKDLDRVKALINQRKGD